MKVTFLSDLLGNKPIFLKITKNATLFIELNLVKSKLRDLINTIIDNNCAINVFFI